MMSSSHNDVIDLQAHVQKRQKVSQDGDRACVAIPSHLLEFICRLVIRCLAKRLPEKYEQLVALSAATGLCNDDDVARLRDSRGCQRELFSIPNSLAKADSIDTFFKHASYNMAGTQIVCITSCGVFFADAKTGTPIRTLPGSFERDIIQASLNPRGTLLVTANFDDDVRVWSVRTGKCIRVLHDTHLSLCASFSHDGKRIAATTDNGSILQIWNAKGGKCVKELQYKDETYMVSALYSPDDSMIVSCFWDDAICNAACIWDAVTGECRRILEGHTEQVIFASFSPDGSMVATSSDDKTARIWRVETGECIHILQGHEGVVKTANFSPNGAHIVTVSFDKTVRIWNVADGRQLFVYGDLYFGECLGAYFARYDPTGTRILATLGDNRANVLSAPVFRFK